MSATTNAPACRDCRFWRKSGAVDNRAIGGQRHEFGECRRFPPERETLEKFPFSRHPVTDPDYWCGEHQPREAARVASCSRCGHSDLSQPCRGELVKCDYRGCESYVREDDMTAHINDEHR